LLGWPNLLNSKGCKGTSIGKTSRFLTIQTNCNIDAQ
jgi:hypothetical protein